MDPRSSETCDDCGTPYEFLPKDERYRVYICVDDASYHFIVAICPNCGSAEQIFTSPEVVIYNIERGLKISATTSDDNLRAARDRAVAHSLAMEANRELLANFHDEVEHIDQHWGEL